MPGGVGRWKVVDRMNRMIRIRQKIVATAANAVLPSRQARPIILSILLSRLLAKTTT